MRCWEHSQWWCHCWCPITIRPLGVALNRNLSSSVFVDRLPNAAWSRFGWRRSFDRCLRLVTTYEAPVRMRPPGYRRTFCGVCCGPLPIVDRGVIRIPAGTLDDDPALRPQRHIFVDFKAAWFDITDGLPRFATK